MTESLLEYCKQFEGVSIHGKNIRLSFYYKSVRCIESIKGVSLTKSNIKFASNKRISILHEIATNSFDYAKHFPESKRINLFSGRGVIPTVNDALDKWLKRNKSNTREDNYKHNVTRCDTYIRPKFGNMRLDKITQTEIRVWRDLTLTTLISNKTINDVFIPLRGIFKDAKADRLIDYNPLEHIKNLKRGRVDSCDPFTMNELSIIQNKPTKDESELNGFLFACWTGIRASECYGLAWEDVDFRKRKIKIRRGVSKGNYAHTKNDGSYRTIDLLDQAYDILKSQKALTFILPGVEVPILQEDNRTIKYETLSFVFRNSLNQLPYSDAQNVNKRFLKKHLIKCEIRYRAINQARHTFASQLLTNGVAERWIAKQMGHTSLAMLEKHYGKWMDSELPDMAKRVSNLFLNSYIENTNKYNETC
jgi:integrase